MKKILWGGVLVLWCVVWAIPAMLRIKEPKFADRIWKNAGVNYKEKRRNTL